MALSIFVAVWGWQNHAQTLAATFAVLTLSLIVYGVYAFRKLRNLE